ncbi:YitT family protein [Scopulibacillus cellulosilyticus]|uniref:YitT family protein n=1 Tax=Scopulibacillus cellulosilyticus TaxID=2665665 RepID=A0ABW2PTZ6_9BACL
MKLSLKPKNIFFILIGAAIYAFGLVNFNMTNKLAEGGITGITLILYNLFNIDPAISNIVLNVPLFILGWRTLGRNSFAYTLIGTGALSVFLWIFQHVHIFSFTLKNDMTLAALFAGVFVGVGLGIIFKYGGTTGGSDIIARLGHNSFGWSIGQIMFAIDAIVIISSLIYLDYRQAMYTLVAVFVGARVIDFIQKGAYAAKAAMIISKDNEAVADKIIKTLDRSTTIIPAKGGYTGNEVNVLYCVVAQNEVFRLKNVISSVDPHAFVAVNDVHEVLGEGFTLDENKNPLHE